MEVNEFERKKGVTEKTKFSKQRLLKLMELNEIQSNITVVNHGLKLTNRLLHANYQMVRVENMNLKRQIQNIEKAENF
jgi:hypothetical protein